MCIFSSTTKLAGCVYRHLTSHSHIIKRQASKLTPDLLNITQNSVIVSQSKDIFENLAFEDWIYKNYDMTSRNICILLIWYNGPSVVIGRHQNPWLECSVGFCEANGINIVRRNSGGGTVYHDFGNLNFSFITSPKQYHRKNNLELICESIRRRWHLNLCVSKRDDILFNEEYKVSGTASKIGRNNAYHHCTILIKVDEKKLRKALYRDLEGVKSKATSSTRAKVINLNSVCEDIDAMSVIRAVTDYYKQIYEVEDKNMLCLHPNESICPGIEEIKEELQSWQWRFGRTPHFEVTRFFPFAKENNLSVEIVLTVSKGVIENILLTPNVLETECLDDLRHFIIGNPFSTLIYVSLEKWMVSNQNSTECHFIKNCIMQMVIDVFR